MLALYKMYEIILTFNRKASVFTACWKECPSGVGGGEEEE
jgi:hypothetical protein